MTWNDPAGASPQPAPRRRNWFRRHKFLTALLAIVALAALAQIGGNQPDPSSGGDAHQGSAPAAARSAETAGSGKTSQDTTPPKEESPEEVDRSDAAGIGDKVAAGDFEYTVTKVTPGVRQIGDSTFGEKPQGQFVLVKLTVTNTGAEAQMFNDSEHKLVDTEGREHSSDGAAAMYVPGNDSFLEEINPGNTLQGTVVFDVPTGSTTKELRLKGPGFWDPEEAVVSVN